MEMEEGLYNRPIQFYGLTQVFECLLNAEGSPHRKLGPSVLLIVG